MTFATKRKEAWYLAALPEGKINARRRRRRRRRQMISETFGVGY